MRWTAALCALVLTLTGCKDGSEQSAPPPAPADAGWAGDVPAMEATAPDDGPFRDLSWTAVSADGTATLTQSHIGGAKCRRTCNDGPGGAEVWSAEGCIGKRIDLRFVGNGCERVVVLHQLPTVPSGRRWEEVEVGHVYNRDRLDYAIQAAGAVRDFKKIRSAGNTFYWLAGALDLPGQAPAYSADGAAVELTTVDGKQQSIPLGAGK